MEQIFPGWSDFEGWLSKELVDWNISTMVPQEKKEALKRFCDQAVVQAHANKDNIIFLTQRIGDSDNSHLLDAGRDEIREMFPGERFRITFRPTGEIVFQCSDINWEMMMAEEIVRFVKSST